jgi:HAD superfamily hydrolase (TIGR01509 family)
MLGERIAARMRVFAGDCVPRKKPAPDIYNLAARELGVEPARCVVIEDSRIGLAAAKAAGMR